MLKQTITYVNYNGQRRTRDFYFNLNRFELMQLIAGKDNKSFQDYLVEISQEQNTEKLIELLKDVILMSYGEKSSDGETFVKNDQIREEFFNSAAFSELYMSLLNDTQAAVNFITGVLPPDLRFSKEQLKEMRKEAANAQKQARDDMEVDPLTMVVADPIAPETLTLVTDADDNS